MLQRSGRSYPQRVLRGVERGTPYGARFPLGETYITQWAALTLAMGSESVHEFLSRHQAANWAEDETSCNESALAHGGIVSSVYLAKEGEIIIGTNLKTNFTKVLLLHEEMNWGDGDDPDVEARRPRNLATAMAFHVDLAALRLSFP